ncbi:MAG: SDR family oxidoreductase [Candidatus Aenigmarchaeota archaeon]|nr:SDR family oxidoreductase [Candidatus Aenigmarchaeota archaeon]
MRVLVTGGSGAMGSKFVTELAKGGNDVLYTYLSRDAPVHGGASKSLDVTDKESVSEVVSGFGPDTVLHLAALTNADLCETNPSLADAVNVRGTENIAEACKKAGSRIVFMSSAFVFDGSKPAFSEDDAPRPINQYGRSKLAAERCVEKSGQPFMILRTDLPYRWSPRHVEKNNIMKLIRAFESGEKYREITDWFNTPTLVDDLVTVTNALIGDWEDGTYHVAGPDFVSRYEFASRVASAMGKDPESILGIKSVDLNLPAKRPNVFLRSDKAESKTGIRMRSLDDGIEEVLRQASVERSG